MSAGYPKTLVHPSYQRSDIQAVNAADANSGRKFTDYRGTPDRYPPITVHNADQEAVHRNLGYLEFGEKPMTTDYAEYPLMMKHPDHESAIPDETTPIKGESGAVTFTVIKGKPEKFPDVQVNDPDEEAEWASKGYARPGLADPKAVESSKAAPHNPNHRHQEWPKQINGRIIADPNAPSDFQKYPMMVGDTVVNNEAEEAAERKRQNLPLPQAAAPIAASEVEELRRQVAALTALVANQQAQPKKSKGGRPKGSKAKKSQEPVSESQPDAAD